MSDKIKRILKELSELTIAENVELVKAAEEEWGVSAAAIVSAAPVAAVTEEDDSEKEVILTSMGEKIKTIKALREQNSELSLMDAKKAVEGISESTPYSLGKFEKAKADELVKRFQEVGASAKIK